MRKRVLPPTAKKVAMNTCCKVNAAIRNQAVCSIDTYVDSGEAILTDKVKQLSKEWDTERFFEANAASCVLLSSIIGLQKKNSYWFAFTGTIGSFLLLHALQGWCPSLPLIRKLGVRTAEEIFQEKTVYKMLRGDFAQNTNDADELLKIAEKE
ncbi:hypothetical protein SDC9_64370 [bioreactor metagenome]|uniref:DUF2892 domain-containing protein n=1 Tax=bioreactor metagenome TaxID=1076179 RepID=A0A644XP42_9ZZZZ